MSKNIVLFLMKTKLTIPFCVPLQSQLLLFIAFMAVLSGGSCWLDHCNQSPEVVPPALGLSKP